jgi:hypothetical protein
MFGLLHQIKVLLRDVHPGLHEGSPVFKWQVLSETRRYRDTYLAGRASWHVLCHIESMSTYVVVPDDSMFAVRLGDADGPVIATFSNKLAAETFAERQRAKDPDNPKAPPDEDRRA